MSPTAATTAAAAGATHGHRAAHVDVGQLAALLEDRVDLADFPHAAEVRDDVLVYEADALRSATASDEGRIAVLSELARALSDGPGVLAVVGAYADTAVVDRASAVFDAVIADEAAAGGGGDHFAEAGANSRIWNALEKLAVRAPDVFVEYYANDAIALVSTAWLGPAYQLTSQVNVVWPGGAAQEPHRDYHLGFMSDATAERYPRHVHHLSPLLTLQGAVVHTDMPVETGPTMLLPHSHRWPAGYVAWRREDVKALFADRMVQLALSKGDTLFFNPALLHGAGTNRTADVARSANLLQVSSAFGRAMEVVDRARVVRHVHPALLAARSRGLDARGVANVVAASAEGYPFPTNLDRDQPVGSSTPTTQAELLTRALDEDWPPERLSDALADHAARRTT